MTEADLDRALEQMSKQPEPVFLVSKPLYDRLKALAEDKILWLGPIFINWSALKRKLFA